MKKIIIVAAVPLLDEGSGVKQKVLSQAKAFTKMGAKVYCLGYGEHKSIILQLLAPGDSNVETQTIGVYRNSHLKRIAFWKCVKEHMRLNSYDLAYIRYPIIDRYVLHVLRTTRESCRAVVMEIPSYPLIFRGEGTLKKLQFEIDKRLQNKCGRYLDRVLYIGNQTNTIFNCDAKQIANGLPESIMDVPQTGYQLKNNTVNIICVSNMYKVHGYDRLIRGLGNYYEKKLSGDYEFTLTMVGDGPCKDEYKRLAKEKRVEKRVNFVGAMYGERLTELYENVTIGISGLGLYREGLQEASSLKTKEYLVRGLPFVYAGKEIGLDDSFPFALKVDNTDEDIDFEQIVMFVKSFKDFDRDYVKEQMKEYALERFNWETILQDSCGAYLRLDSNSIN